MCCRGWLTSRARSRPTARATSVICPCPRPSPHGRRDWLDGVLAAARDEGYAIVDAVLSPTAILHLQNGLVLTPWRGHAMPPRLQTSFHQDFPPDMGAYVASINTFLAIDDFTSSTARWLLVPRSHQRAQAP